MGKKVVGLPTDGSLLQMYYRQDVLQRFNLTVPQTWDDVLEVARAVHMKVDTDGDGQGDMAATCFHIAGERRAATRARSRWWATLFHRSARRARGAQCETLTGCDCPCQWAHAGRCMGNFMLPAVIASYLQYGGTDNGFYFDPATVPPRPLADNEGVLAALRFWRDLAPYMANSPICAPSAADFRAGKCALTFSW